MLLLRSSQDIECLCWDHSSKDWTATGCYQTLQILSDLDAFQRDTLKSARNLGHPMMGRLHLHSNRPRYQGGKILVEKVSHSDNVCGIKRVVCPSVDEKDWREG